MSGIQKLRDRANDIVLLVTLGGIGAAVLTPIQKYWPDYAPIVTTAMTGFVLAMAIGVLYKVFTYLRHQQRKHVDEHNVEGLVREVADVFGLGIKRVDDEKTYFNLQMRTESGATITVARGKKVPHFLVIKISLQIRDNDLELLRRLSADEVERLCANLRVELNRGNLEHTGVAAPLTQPFSIHRLIPITGLTDYQLLTAIQQINHARNVISDSLRLALRRNDRAASG